MTERDVQLGDLPATLGLPQNARGLVIFAHGSGSGRLSPRNRIVAANLNAAGIATLLLDLLTEDDIGLLARRIVIATDWVRSQRELEALPIGYFGASTGAGAALVAASGRDDVRAIVSRGGRPDLAAGALDTVAAPTLLIVGSRDPVVLELNRGAAKRLKTCELAIVPGATHLFEEAGTLEDVTTLARRWFLQHLTERAAP